MLCYALVFMVCFAKTGIRKRGKNEKEDKLGINFETQLEILIASEENPELRENLKEYCQKSRKHPDFDEEQIVDDILSKNFSYL